MEVNLLKKLLAVPTETGRENRMVRFLLNHVATHGSKRGLAYRDSHNNVFVIKGNARYLPCLAAHIDTVHSVDCKVRIEQQGDILVGYDLQGCRAGIGADDKTGIMVCLEALDRLDNVALAFFAGEEQFCRGAFAAAPEFFDKIGYLLEWDCPSDNLFSYTNSGVRLFENDGEFIQRALPHLQERNMLWQNHPYTDTLAVRRRYPISCMNLSSGYYNWHSCDEYARISNVEGAIELAVDLVGSLGSNRYEFPVKHNDHDVPPLVEVGPLVVRDNAFVEYLAEDMV